MANINILVNLIIYILICRKRSRDNKEISSNRVLCPRSLVHIFIREYRMDKNSWTTCMSIMKEMIKLYYNNFLLILTQKISIILE